MSTAFSVPRRALSKSIKRTRCLSSTAVLQSQKSSGSNSSGATSSPPTSKEGKRPKRRVVFSGIQPTGIPHIGNYFGALRHWVTLQNSIVPTSTLSPGTHSDQLYFSIVGWHALTTPPRPSYLKVSESKLTTLASLLAIGLDTTKCNIFYQEDNPDHLELSWILSCLAPMGKLQRMTTWKSKLDTIQGSTPHITSPSSALSSSALNLGLFSYPVLQSADILAYKSTQVPVGADQTQHLELARDLAHIFNKRVGKEVFPLPNVIYSPTTKILSLRNPKQKMSKSSPDTRSRVQLNDSKDDIAVRIKAAVTDSIPNITYEPKERPGVSNLLTILSCCTGEDVLDVAKRYEGEKSHKVLKEEVTEKLEEVIKPIRETINELRDDEELLKRAAEDGAQHACTHSHKTLKEVRGLLGLS